MIFTNIVDVLNYLWNNHEQTLMDDNLTFKWLRDRGHIEFYQFGSDLAACPIYDNEKYEYDDVLTRAVIPINRRELLIAGPGMDTEVIDLAVKEMIKMIKRKKLGPGVTRRIKDD